MKNKSYDYKIKHIISLNKDIMENKFFIMNIENQEYLFFIVRVATEIIELNGYIFYKEVNIPEHTENIYNFNDCLYHFLTIDFKEINETNIIITPIGIFKPDLNLHISFREIETEETPLTKKLKYLILNDYEPTIYKNKEKLIEKEIDYQKELDKRKKLLKEIKEFEKIQEEKRKNLEKVLNSNAHPKKDKYEKFKDDLRRHKL